jgi:hypothetical protein
MTARNAHRRYDPVNRAGRFHDAKEQNPAWLLRSPDRKPSCRKHKPSYQITRYERLLGENDAHD